MTLSGNVPCYINRQSAEAIPEHIIGYSITASVILAIPF